MARPITFLSDYGADDEFAGVCRAVIARIAPEATVIDLTHGVRRHAVRQGATILGNALPYAPPGVHLAVIDPGVGTPRRAVAVRTARTSRSTTASTQRLARSATGALRISGGGPMPQQSLPTSSKVNGPTWPTLTIVQV